MKYIIAHLMIYMAASVSHASELYVYKNKEGNVLYSSDKDEMDKALKARQAAMDAKLARLEQESQERYEKLKAERDALAKKPNARIGMTAKQVREKTNWGKPVDINRTITKYGTNEQWVYEGNQYLYFENGKLTAIQQ